MDIADGVDPSILSIMPGSFTLSIAKAAASVSPSLPTPIDPHGIPAVSRSGREPDVPKPGRRFFVGRGVRA